MSKPLTRAKKEGAAAAKRSRIFFVNDCIDYARINTLIIAFEEDDVTIPMMEQAYSIHSPKILASILSVRSNDKKTCAIHELLRSARWTLIKWVGDKLLPEVPELLNAREPVTNATPLHALAQRPEHEPPTNTKYWNVLTDFFAKASFEVLRVRDAADYSVMHYLTLNNMRSVYRVLDELHGNKLATDGDPKIVAERLRSEQLEQKLARSEHRKRQLELEVESQRGAQELLQEQQQRLKHAMTQQEIKIRELHAKLGITNDSKQKLVLQEAALMNRDETVRANIEGLQRERDAALAQAKESQAKLAQSVADLRAAKAERRELEDSLSIYKEQFEKHSSEVLGARDARDKMSERIKKLQKKADEAAAAADADTEKSQKEAVALKAEMQTLEDQLEELEDQVRDAELHRKQVADSLREAQADLEERDADLARLEEAEEKARQTNTRLQQELQQANEKQLATERQLESLELELSEVRAAHAANEQRRQEFESRAAAERGLLETQIADGQSLLERARDEAREQRERAEQALAQIGDAERKNAEAAEMEERERAAQARLDEMEKLNNEMKTSVERLQEQFDAEKEQLAKQAEEAEQRAAAAEEVAQKNADIARDWSLYHDTTTADLKRQLEEKEERYRLARQQIDEKQTLDDERQALVEQQSLEIEALRNKLKETRTQTGAPSVKITGAEDGEDPSEAKKDRVRKPSSRKSTLSQLALKNALSRPISCDFENSSDSSPASTPRSRQRASLRRLKIDPAREKQLMVMNCNVRNNRAFWSRVANSVREGNVELLRQLFSYGLSPNCCDFDTGNCLLEIAIRSCSDTFKTMGNKHFGTETSTAHMHSLQEMVDFLLASGAEWDELESALDKGRADGSLRLPDSVMASLRKRDNCSPFIRALVENDPVRVAELIDGVADLDRVPELDDKQFANSGFSLVHIAVHNARKSKNRAKAPGKGGSGGVSYPNEATLQMLVRRGACCTTTDANERTPLHLACMKSDDIERSTFLHVIEYLMAGGADPEEPCPYAGFLEVASGGATKKNALSKAFGKRKPLKKEVSAQSEQVQKYGTPMAFAKQRKDNELLALFCNRRYKRVTEEMLQTYVSESVRFACCVHEMRSSGDLADDGDEEADTSPLVRRCERYRNVFQSFNGRLAAIYGERAMQTVLREDAHVDEVDSDEEARAKIMALVNLDEFFINHIVYRLQSCQGITPEQKCAAAGVDVPHLDEFDSAYLDSIEPVPAAQINAQPLWHVCKLLKNFMTAVTERWFDVSDLIYTPARDAFPDACVAALHEFVKLDQTDQVAHMIGREDRLYGDLTVDTIVYEQQQFTCIDLAAHYGSVRTLEWLAQRQRSRVQQPGPSRRTLFSIADSAKQPVSIVALDHFLFQSGMSSERNSHAMMYGTVSDSGENVLHQCVNRSRDDLLRSCVDCVQFHLDARNRAGQTPRQLADMLYANRSGAPTAAKLRSMQSCAQILREAEDGGDIDSAMRSVNAFGMSIGDDSDGSESSSRLSATFAEPPPTLDPPPPLSKNVPSLQLPAAPSVEESAPEANDTDTTTEDDLRTPRADGSDTDVVLETPRTRRRRKKRSEEDKKRREEEKKHKKKKKKKETTQEE